MIHVITRGGLGNQMFQYAYALRLLLANDEQKIMLNGGLHAWSRDQRQLGLNHFQLTEGTRVCTGVSALFYFILFVAGMVRVTGVKTLLKMLKFDRSTLSLYREALLARGKYCPVDSYEMPPVAKNPGMKHLYGYFQSPDVVKGIENELRRAFEVKTPPSPENAAMLREIQSQNAVCLHVRRGDYGLYPQYQVCDGHYYQEAVAQACDVLKNPVFYVFSTGHDDLEWVKANYHFDAEVRYVDLENPDFEELRLMMACRHFIIANSTFSWWAAVLSSAAGNDKQVWAPAEWLKDSPVCMNMDTWHVVR